VVGRLRPLLENPDARATMQSDLRTVGAALKVNREGAIEHAARIALALVPAAPSARLQSALISSWPAE
jgi:hypothetical protein